MFIPGQRYYSQGEPELGLGLIKSVADKTVELVFPEANITRVYGSKTAPIKRVIFAVEDEIEVQGITHIVKAVSEENGLTVYMTEAGTFSEVMLDSRINLNGALDKFFALKFDSNALYKNRYQSYLKKRNYQLFKNKGLLGARIRLLHHQAYLTQQVSERLRPKVMLCDEVGLGKTIEAGLILSSLILKEKSHKVLILAPDSLVYQWFFELKFKFNLNFAPLSLHDELGIEPDHLQDENLFIVSMNRLLQEPKLQQEVLDGDFDTFILDESHQFSHESEISLIRSIVQNSIASIFLSATPMANGEESFFQKLALLEPEKFNSYDDFQKEQREYKELLPKVERILKQEHSSEDLNYFFSQEEQKAYDNHDKIIQALIDRHGTSRIYFRNTRDYLEKFDISFPKRVLHKKPIENSGKLNDKIVFEKKTEALREILNKYPQEKVLLIVHARELAKKIYKALETTTTEKLALFTSEQSLMERDRQAAYFAEEDGARLLICTEVGSEGRNFEFASHLFLFDIPKIPDLLEQRIGRLDRIGQENQINIHIPYVEQSFEEVLIRWYNEVLGSFNKVPKGAYSFYRDHKDRLIGLLESYDAKELELFLEQAKENYEKYLKKLKEGHDSLVDINSFRFEESQNILREVQKFNQENDLATYLEDIFDSFGVHFSELNSKSYFIKPTETMLLPSYPSLPMEGFSVTFDRDFALKRNDLQFLSFEHPLTINTIELFTSSDMGNTSVVSHEGEISEALLFEFIFKLEVIAQANSTASEFLPVTPLRVLLNSKAQDLTPKITKKFVDSVCKDYGEDAQILSQLPKDSIKELHAMALSTAKKKAQKHIQNGSQKLQEYFQLEVLRLEQLKQSNALISDSDIANLKNHLKTSNDSIERAKVELDAIRVIIQK